MQRRLRNLVRTRAGNRCEYCRIHQDDDPFFRFHIEHVVPRQHGGKTRAGNLALACHYCNFHKGPNLSGIDPQSGDVVSLYSPREQTWEEHFATRGPLIVGRTSTGRAAVRVLAMNAPTRIEIRRHALSDVQRRL
jgi:hypothetical protein